MKKILIQFAILFCSHLALISQSIDIKWSEQLIYDNKHDGFFDTYLGTNAGHVYAKFSNLALSPKKQDNQVKIMAFDKVTMKKVGEVGLKGYTPSYEHMDYYRSIILEDIIYVVWTRETNGILSVYVESFDNKLKRLNKLREVYQLNRGKSGYDNLFVIYNKDFENKIIVAKEFAATKDNENLRIEYKLLNADFSVASSRQVTLPVFINKKRRGLFGSASRSFNENVCSYEFGDDGYLYVQDMIKIADEDKKMLKKGEASVYPHVMQVNLESGDYQEYHLKFMKKNTFNFSSLITKQGIKLYGFFSDLDKDEKGKDTHGTFYIALDTKTFKPTDVKFSYFDKAFLDVLFAADKENQKKGGGIFKSKKAKASDDESIDDNYVIERVIEDGDDIILFCSIMRNWSRTVCTSSSNGGSTCRTYYYCTKSNVTAFKLNPSGNILWAKNLDRSITYNRWNVYDLSVVKDADNYYVVYGSAFQMNAKKKNRRSSKSGTQMTDRLEYAVFAGKDGNFKKTEYQVNNFNVKKKDKKQVSPSNIAVYDNRMYTNCSKTRMKPATFIACLCPPVFYFLMFSGNSKKGQGNLGTIAPLK